MRLVLAVSRHTIGFTVDGLVSPIVLTRALSGINRLLRHRLDCIRIRLAAENPIPLIRGSTLGGGFLHVEKHAKLAEVQNL